MKKILFIILFSICVCVQAQKITGTKVTGTRVGFRPTDFSGCILWLESESVTGIDTSTLTNRVTTWTDLSGNSNNGTQSTLANEPAYGLSTQAGYRTVRFDGAQRLLFSGSITNVTNGNDIHFSLIVVAKQDGTGNDVAVSWGNSTNATPLIAYRNFITPNLRVTRTDNAAGSATANISAAAGTGWQIGRYLYNGTQFIGGMNGAVAQGNQNVAAITLNQFTIGAFGGNGTFANPFNGDLLAVVVYNRLLSPADGMFLDKYFNGKYKVY